MNICKFLGTVLLNCSLVFNACAQSSATPPAPGAAPPAAGSKAFSKAELNQLVAPIALYPDPLLAQVLMGSTYPLEVVAAERWVKANPGLKDKALEDSLAKQQWDASVKSLTVFPDVLKMMSEKIDWTQKLGDAFLAQQQEVLATVQELRKKAADQGNLQSTKEQTVTSETSGSSSVIQIQPTNPNVVYVPSYNPTVVYGAWPYPSYPPYYYPPGYVAGAAFFTFAAGAIVGGALWGNCNWGRGDVSVNVNKYNNFNRANIQSANWQHNASHRGAVPYRDQRVAQQYGRRPAADAASREQFRGRAEAGRSSIQRGEVAGNVGGRETARQANATAGRNAAGQAGAGRDASGRDNSARTASANRGSAGGSDTRGIRNDSAFDTGRTASTRDFSNRGSTSLGSARASGSVGGGGGGSRGSFGGGRGGGGGGRR